jgi:N-acetylglucosaminyl-diphospho-decaprenol L-rhamnosyltransferase
MVAGEVVLVCNPDLVVHAGVVRSLAAAFTASPSVGAAGPRIDRPDGTRYPSARAFPSIIDAAGHGFIGLVTTANPFSRRYLRPEAEEGGAVDWVSGACLAVRRSAFEQIGGFDESFFMFMEDVDLSWRLGRHGWGVVYVPAGRVTHVEGVSREAAPYRMIVAHHWSLLRYGMRTTTGVARLWLPVVAAGLAVRTALLCGRRALTGR